jgi:hypothetical protein
MKFHVPSENIQCENAISASILSDRSPHSLVEGAERGQPPLSETRSKFWLDSMCLLPQLFTFALEEREQSAHVEQGWP